MHSARGLPSFIPLFLYIHPYVFSYTMWIGRRSLYRCISHPSLYRFSDRDDTSVYVYIYIYDEPSSLSPFLAWLYVKACLIGRGLVYALCVHFVNIGRGWWRPLFFLSFLAILSMFFLPSLHLCVVFIIHIVWVYIDIYL